MLGKNEALAIQVEEHTAALAQANARLQEQIHARQRAEALLAAERNILRVLIDHLPDRIAVKNTLGQFVLLNAATLQYLAATAPDQVKAKIDTELPPPAWAAQLDADEQAIVQSGLPLINREETLIHDETGVRSWVLTTKVPVRDSQGQIIGLVSMSRDITRRKLAAQYLALRF